MSAGAHRNDAPSAASLRARALEAARTLLKRQGPDALQLRVIAAHLKCSPSTLYYHFASKDALLAGVAADGFRDLERRMARAADETPADSPSGAAGAYISFILQNLSLCAIMFDERRGPHARKAHDAERAAFQALRGAFESDARVTRERVDDLATLSWVLGRGIAATLFARGSATGGEPEAIVQRVQDALNYLVSVTEPAP